MEDAFQRIKQCLIEAPVLSCPDYSLSFVVETDASGYEIGAVLTQPHPDGERVISFLSRSLSKQARNYSVVERELLAVLHVEKLRPYLEGVHFSVITDHFSLKWLHNLKDPTGRLARWAVRLQQYDFTVIEGARIVSYQTPFQSCTCSRCGKKYSEHTSGTNFRQMVLKHDK